MTPIRLLLRRAALPPSLWLAVALMALSSLAGCGDDALPAGSTSDDADVGVEADAPGGDATGDLADDDSAGADTGGQDDAVSDTATMDTRSDAGPTADASDDAMDDTPDGASDAPLDGAHDDVDADAPSDDTTEPPDEDGGVEIAFSPESIGQRDEVFALGVQSGAMTADGARVWTYSTDDEDKVLRVWRESETEGNVVLVRELDRLAPSAGYLQVELEGLAPGTWYSYAFFERDGEGALAFRSRIGRFRTALAEGSREPLLIGATSCTTWRLMPYEALSLTASQGIDMFLHIGDQSYNDSDETLEEYRSSWFDTLSDPGYLDLYQAAGAYHTWDDHEVTDNYDPETISADRLRVAKRAFFESHPVERGEDGELWRSYRWGDTAEVFILDSRSERRPSTRRSDDAIYLSRAQMDWLKQALVDSEAHFKIIMNSVPITNMPLLWDVASGDRWEGYASQRDELLNHIIDEHLRNVWFLGGDFHIGFVSRVEPSGAKRRIREIAVGPGANGPNPLGIGLDLSGQFDFVTNQQEVMTTLRFDPDDNSVQVRFVDASTESVLYDEVLRDGE